RRDGRLRRRICPRLDRRWSILDNVQGGRDRRKKPMKPIVAIVGRPNVGKSTLFNRLTQSRQAIVEDQPGVTRDRLYADTEWNGRVLTLVDTGGIQLDKEGDTIEAHVTRQAELAIREADAIIFVVDVTDGVTAPDLDVAELLRRV